MESIFEKDFYPTPPEVIGRMMTGHDASGKIILEPSAGSGNIVEWLQANFAAEVLACEKNEKLRRIVAAKCRVLAGDFLTLCPEDISHIDMIVMNPPFSDARRHILHAYDIAPEGCEIISLCNSSDLTYHQWHSSTQDQKKVQQLVDDYGFEESFGECFTTAERKTDVRVSCIHLYKPKTGAAEFEDYSDFSLEQDMEGSAAAGLIQYNVIRDVVNRYVEAVRRYEAVEAASQEINDLTSLFCNGYGGDIKFGAYQTGDRNTHQRIDRNTFKKHLQKQAWRYIIRQLDMNRFTTSKVHEQINAFVERQVHLPFTMRNVYQMLYLIANTQDQRMNTALVEVFDNICSFSAENSTAGEKWKTNANYMVNRRFIVPCMTDYDSRWPYDYLKLNYSCQPRKIADVIKALTHITGQQPSCDYEDYIRNNRLSWGQWHECGTFFRFRGYKKGTMHFEFVDEKVWELFNRRVAEIKGWDNCVGSTTRTKKTKSR